MPDQELDGADIKRHLTEVAHDSITALDNELRTAVEVVAERHRLDPQWLNDKARPFAPQTLRTEDCEVLLDLPSLRVLGAPLRHAFLMKVAAGRRRDEKDLVRLWPLSGLATETANRGTGAGRPCR